MFAGIHFIGNFKRFGGMMPLYTAMGIYMWLAAYFSGSLFCAAVLHGSYNLAAILQIKFRERLGA
jgi:membrane protease YdiL (CAAX protease family)